MKPGEDKGKKKTNKPYGNRHTTINSAFCLSARNVVWHVNAIYAEDTDSNHKAEKNNEAVSSCKPAEYGGYRGSRSDNWCWVFGFTRAIAVKVSHGLVYCCFSGFALFLGRKPVPTGFAYLPECPPRYKQRNPKSGKDGKGQKI